MTIAKSIDSGISSAIATGIYPGAAAAPPAGATLAFHALTSDDSTYEMLGVKTGTGSLTTTHTSTLYALDAGDPSTSPIGQPVYRELGANEAVWSGGRVVTNYLANPDAPVTQQVPCRSGEDWVFSAYGIGDYAITGPGISETVVIASGTERRATPVITPNADGNITVTVNSAGTQFQLENVSGQTNQNPGERVTGTKVFGNQNGNTVA